ncbi:hypothetical protein ACQEWB_29095 [Streptomyces sp. CA-249302]|uniref:hypothetical protein n=1 Tax=Streptomyces sp. CA-249302 TaxID=3240058 RepID=UPI003D90C421
MTDVVYGPTDARPGQPTCLRRDCRQFTKLELGGRCRGCGHRTSIRPRPDLYESLGYQSRPAAVPPMPSGPPPVPAAPPRPAAAPLGARETASRAVFGGFWCLIAVAGVVAAMKGLTGGDFGGFLLSALVATGSGFYARYIFRGGRFRILFW